MDQEPISPAGSVQESRYPARRLLAALARLLPVKSQAVYRALRFVYRRIPVALEDKMPWAQHLLADVPELQQVAYRVARTQSLPPALGAYVNRSWLDAPLLPTDRRILVVEHRLPTPDRNASSVRLFAMLRLLRELDWQVTFVSNTKRSDYSYFLSEPECTLPRYEQLLSDLGITHVYGMEALLQHLQLEGGCYRYAILSYPEIMHQYAPVVRALMAHAELIYDTVDLHGVRFAREAATKNDDPVILEKAAYYQRMELANIECADITIPISDVEQRQILEYVPAARTEIVPMIHCVSTETPSIEAREGLLFIGHYSHTPNEDALVYFVREVLPLIGRELRGIPFYALGSSLTSDLKRLDSEAVRMIGYVEDPVPWFARARVFVAPLRYGAGMKGKIGQSLGLGLPVVTTSVGAEGMRLEHGKNVLIANSPDDFASAVVMLYQDTVLWRTLAENGKAHIAAHFSYDAARQALANLLSNNTGRFMSDS